MRQYEAMIIVRPDLDKEAYEEVHQKVVDELNNHEGKMGKWDVWKEKSQLAYPLNSRGAERQVYNQGTYIQSEFELSPENIGRIKYRLDLDERVLRYLLINRGG